MSLLAWIVQHFLTSPPPFTTLYEIFWCHYFHAYPLCRVGMIIFQRSKVWFERPFDKLVGDWLTKMPEGLSWLPYFRLNFRAAPKNSWLSKLPHFPPEHSSCEVEHPCWIHLFHSLCYSSKLSVFLEHTVSCLSSAGAQLLSQLSCLWMCWCQQQILFQVPTKQ